MKLTYSGKYALVTGGTSGLAIQLAGIMINSDLFPILTYRNDKGLHKINQALKSFDGLYSAVFLDFNDRLSLETLFLNFDKIDYLIDLAHGNLEKLIASASGDEIYKYFEENVSFRAGLIKSAAKAMLKNKKGRMIFISSTSAGKSNPGQGFYAAAKLASEALYRNLGLELAGRGITALTLRTAYIDAGRGKKYFENNTEKILNQMPIGRILTAAEVAETIMFFLSDSASGFNAAEINLDGGFSASK